MRDHFHNRRGERRPFSPRRHSEARRPSPSHQGGGRAQENSVERSFLSKTAIDPSPRIRLENGSTELTMRAMDLICPIGMGQRGLIVAPPGSGKTTFLKHLCFAIAKAYPAIKLYCLLIDERPEEVTDFRRTVTAEVHWSSSDEQYENHIRVANELMQKAFQQADAGENVVVLVDSLTRLARVHNAERQSSGRTLSGGVDARALEIPRRIFGAARKIENGGSLTLLATILVETGSRMDQVIFEEFKGTGNMEIYLSREISGRRIYPAIDMGQSATRKEELLMEEWEIGPARKLRRALAELDKVSAAQTLVEQLQKFPTNKELLMAVDKMAL